MNLSYEKHVYNTERRTLAEKLVLYCGMPANLCGFDKLVDCCVAASYLSNCPLKEIYRTVASMYGVAPQAVSRSITYALSKAHDFASAFADVVGSHVRASDLHSGMIIVHFGKIIDNNELSPLFDTSIGSFFFGNGGRGI